MKTLTIWLCIFTAAIVAQELTENEIYQKIYSWEYTRQVTEELLQFAQHSNNDIRLRSIRALGHIQKLEAIDVIAQNLKHENIHIRRESAFALGQMWDSSCEQILLAALTTETNSDVLDKIIEALGKTGSEKTIEVFISLLKKEDSCESVTQDNESVTQNNESVTQNNESVTQNNESVTYACGLLAYRGIFSEALIKALIARANDENSQVRENVSYALMRIKEPRTMHHLVQMMYDKSSLVKANAARGLGYIKNEKSLPHLYLALHDKNVWVVVNALNALRNFTNINAEKIVPLLSSKNDHIALSTIRLCGDLKLSLSEATLCQMLTESSSLYKGEILKALSLINPELFATWLDEIEDDSIVFQSKIADALGNIDTEKSFEQLITMSETDNMNVLQMIASSLGKIKTKDTTAILEKMLDTMDMAVVTYAAQALAERKSQSSLAPLIATYQKMKLPVDIEPMQAIIEAVASLTTEGNKKGISFLQDVAKSNNQVLSHVAQNFLRDLNIGFFTSSEEDSAIEILFSYEEIQNLQPYKVRVATEHGDFIIEAFTKDAPVAALNFKKLIEKKFYDGLNFHRVVSNFVVQGGDPRGDGWGGPGYVIPCEYNLHRYTRGMVGMPLAGKDTGGCQLFITHSPQPHLNGKYTIFGQVIEGMDIVDKIQEFDIIKKMTIEDN